MKTIAAVAMIAFGLKVSAAFGAESIPQLVARTKPATIQIMALDENWSPVKTGTGFFISPDGLAVTNYHVIQGASHLAGRTNEGAVFQFERLVAHPQGVDLAILKFAADGAAYLKLGHSTDAVEGQTVLVIGNPEGLQGSVSEGIISAFRENRSMIQITAPISPGSSGSPVMDELGQVIGVATMVTREGQNLGFAIAVEEVQRALAAPSVAIEPPPVNPLQSNPPQSNPNEKADRVLRAVATEYILSGNFQLSTERWRSTRSVWITSTKGLKALTRFAPISPSTERSGPQGVTRFHASCDRSMMPRGTLVPSLSIMLLKSLTEPNGRLAKRKLFLSLITFPENRE